MVKLKNIFICFVLFAGAVYCQTKSETRVQIIRLSPLNDTTDNLLENQPFGARPNPHVNKSIRVGEILIDGKKYKCALYYFLNRKTYAYSHLWIDTIVNDKYDYWQDYLEEVRIPFTLFGKSYLAAEVDSLGSYMKVEECDPEIYPPIQVGMPAPDIEFTTLNDENINLYSFHKKFKVLFFWSCQAVYHAAEMEKVIEYYKGKEIAFINSSLGPYDGDKNNRWVHFYNDFYEKQRMKYQVGSLQKMFIIDNDNKILAIIDGYQEAKDLINEIEKVILE